MPVTDDELHPGRTVGTAVTSPWEVGMVRLLASDLSERTMASLASPGLLEGQLLCRFSLSEEFEAGVQLEGG